MCIYVYIYIYICLFYLMVGISAAGESGEVDEDAQAAPQNCGVRVFVSAGCAAGAVEGVGFIGFRVLEC